MSGVGNFFRVARSLVGGTFMSGSACLVGTLTQLCVNGTVQVGDGHTETRVLNSGVVNGTFTANKADFEETLSVNGNFKSTNCRFIKEVEIFGNAQSTNSHFQDICYTGAKLELNSTRVKELKMTVPRGASFWTKPVKVHLTNNSEINRITFHGAQGTVFVDANSRVGEVANGEIVRN